MNWSIPIQAGWKLRILTGSSRGREIDLTPARYVLGSNASATIVLPHPSIAPQHVVLEVQTDRVEVRDCSSGRGFRLNDKPVVMAQVVPGDRIRVGDFEFQFINPGLPGTPPLPVNPTRHGVQRWFNRFSRWQRVGMISAGIALLLYALLALTGNTIIVPATLLAMSAVVPATVIVYLVDTHDQTGISLRTLSVTFLAGGTLGVVAAMLFALMGGTLSLGLLLLPAFAGLFEEPAKLLATCWRWRHPAYDRPLDGLIIGTVSGLGFAVFETAGYGLHALLAEGYEGLLGVMLFRSLASPFAHGLWSGILAAAFWQSGRDLRQAWPNREFQIALLWAVGMHVLWNLGANVGGLGLLLVVLSGYLSLREYRRLLSARGYR